MSLPMLGLSRLITAQVDVDSVLGSIKLGIGQIRVRQTEGICTRFFNNHQEVWVRLADCVASLFSRVGTISRTVFAAT